MKVKKKPKYSYLPEDELQDFLDSVIIRHTTVVNLQEEGQQVLHIKVYNPNADN